jgi:hypothetical protein
MTTKTPPCPGCGQPASGAFCSTCGTALGAARCAACGATRTGAGAFCSTCGAPAGAAVATGGHVAPRANVNGILAGLLVVAVVAVGVAMLMRDGPAGGGTQAVPLGTPVGAATGPAGAATTDIWSMTPRERYTRLTDRIEAAIESGDTAQVVQFYPMAEGAFDMLLPGDRDLDARFHIAMLRAQVGQVEQARVQLDSMRLESPDNLLGYYLESLIAEQQNDAAAMTTARAAFNRVYDAEIASGREEYQAHAPMLEQFRQNPGGT